MNKTLIGAAIVVIVVGGFSFYGGLAYGKSGTSAGTTARLGGQFAGGAGARGMGGTTIGTILSKDATSITLKMQDGSTKIALFSTSTSFMKTTTSSVDDLSAGAPVVVMGTNNSDGSITARSVMIRPAGSQSGSQRAFVPLQN